LVSSISGTAQIGNDNSFSIGEEKKQFARASVENRSTPSLRMDQLYGIGWWLYNYQTNQIITTIKKQ